MANDGLITGFLRYLNRCIRRGELGGNAEYIYLCSPLFMTDNHYDI